MVYRRAIRWAGDMLGMGGRRQQPPQSNYPWQHPPSYPSQQYPQAHHPPPHPSPPPPVIQEEWVFLSSFEQLYGTTHPFFYACRFADAVKIAQDDHKFLFVYLHLPEHPFAGHFCLETLCSELVTQFLDANFVSWAGFANRGEGQQLVTTLRASGFPFCALVAPVAGGSIAVLRQFDGPVSPEELVDVLQRTLEEQGMAFGSGRAREDNMERAREDERRMADRQLREEQDAAYLAALQLDQERERVQKKPRERTHRQGESLNKPNDVNLKQNLVRKESSKIKEASQAGGSQPIDIDIIGKDVPSTQVLIRFPNGERREQSFLCTDKIQAIYRYIDSLGLPGVGNYRLVSSFPRRIYGVDEMGMTLKDAGLHPKASIFLELL